MFPESAELVVKRVPTYKQRQADAAIEEVRDDDTNVAVSYTFDIKVIDPETKEELQPAEGQNVEVSFALAEAADDNLDTNVYHVTAENGEMTAEKLESDVDADAETVTATTEGFSLYTVEFTYNNLEYVMQGDTSVALSEILEKVGLTGAVEAVAVSDDSLFSASNGTGEWLVTAHQAFSTTEWMKVTIGGITYEIIVTDEQTFQVKYPKITIDENGDYGGQIVTEYLPQLPSQKNIPGGTYGLFGNVYLEDRMIFEGDTTLVISGWPGNSKGFGLYVEGLSVVDGATLTICRDVQTGPGEVVSIVKKGKGAGIGSYTGHVGGTIVMYDIRVTAKGGENSAGIGGIEGQKSPDIRMLFDYVDAEGGSGGAGIGSGKGQDGGSIIIRHPYQLIAKGGSGAAGIGGGEGGAAGKILIHGSSLADKYQITGGNGGAGVGSGKNAKGSGEIVISESENDSKGIVVTGGSGAAGIGAGQGSNGGNITITSGTVKATGGKNGAGIGAGEGGNGGNIAITGGYVIATGGQNGAGIGAGRNSDGGTIKITGGTVTATGTDSSAGIGGGDADDGKREDNSTIEISGGTVTATGNSKGAGIGGGKNASGSDITIYGGHTDAYGGSNGAGIGGGLNGDGGTIHIYGSYVSSVSGTGKGNAAGIGGGSGSKTTNADILIEGFYAHVIATGAGKGAGIGGGGSGCATVNILDGTIEAAGGTSGGAGIGSGADGAASTIDISGGEIDVNGTVGMGNKKNKSSIITLSYSDATKDHIQITSSSYGGKAILKNAFMVNDYSRMFPVSEYPLGAGMSGKTLVPYAPYHIKYLDLNDKLQFEWCLPVVKNVTNWETGWYWSGKGEMELSGEITVTGDVNLILEDDEGGYGVDRPSKLLTDNIKVPEGSSLTIWGQNLSSGYLQAKANMAGRAGIGGSGDSGCGTITINGGIIDAIGNEGGACIGGGWHGGAGNITITGGTVNARHGNGRMAVIGCGANETSSSVKNNGTITITGGVVNANGGEVGIGGCECNGGVTVNITGGSISAVGLLAGLGGIPFVTNGLTAADCVVNLDWTEETRNTMSVYIGSTYDKLGSWRFNDLTLVKPFKIKETGNVLKAGTYLYKELYNKTLVPADYTTCKVTFDSDGGSAVAAQTVIEGDKATEPAAPTRRGSAFSGWQKDGADYDFNTPVTGNITLKAVWTANELSVAKIGDRTYNGTAQAPALTVTDALTGELLKAGVDYTDAFENNRNAGTATVTVTGIGDYAASKPVNSTFKINAAPATVTGLSALDKTYDGSTTATVAGTPMLSGVIGDDSVALGEVKATFDSKQAGNGKAVTFTGSLTGADAGNYTMKAQPASGKANILPKEVSLTWTNTYFTYDGQAHAPTATAKGLVAGDTCTVTVTGAQTDAGTYSATATALTGADAGNYKLSAKTKQWPFKIAKAPAAAVTPPVAMSGLTYTGKAQALVSAGSVPGSTLKYSIDSGVSWNESIPTGRDAGSYSVYYMVDPDQNHEGSGPMGPVTVTIAKAPLTVKAKDMAITYGDAIPGFEVEYTGFVNNETKSVLSGNLAYACVYAQYGNAGSYAITPSGQTSGNYNIRFLSGTLTVKQKDVGLQWSDSTTFTFDGGSYAPAAMATGLVNSDAVSVAVEGAEINVGSYTATASALTGEKAGNYKLPAANTQAFSIVKANALPVVNITRYLTYTATNVNIALPSVMPENAGTLTYKTNGWNNTGTVTVSEYAVDGNGTVTAKLSNVQVNAQIIFHLAISSQNYKDSPVDLTVILTDRKDAVVSILGEDVSEGKITKTYGAPNFTLTASATNKGSGTGTWTWASSNSDAATVNDNGEVEVKNRGETTLTATYVSDTTSGQASVTLTVNPKSLNGATVQVSRDYPYTGRKIRPADGDVTVTLDGERLIGGKDYSFTPTERIDVGTSDLTVNGSGNYTGSTRGSYTITKAPVTITTGSASKAYDGTALTNAEKHVSGLVLGDPNKVKVTTTGSQTDVGSSMNGYSIDWGNVKASKARLT